MMVVLRDLAEFSDLIILLLAILLDLTIGEPPVFIHPVCLFGKIVEIFKKFRRNFKPVVDFLYGVLTVLAVVLIALLLSKIQIFLIEVYLLFASISIKSMIDHARNCIGNGIIRQNVQKIVSRDVSKLNDYQLCSAVIESIAENFVDGVFSPLFYFAIFGLPGALIYRAVNVCDAMIGYKKYYYFGKFAARLDDLLNYIPARLSLILFEVLKRGSIKYGIKNNVKLNGCAISAMSYVLGVKLEKPGYYSLPGRYPKVEDVFRAIDVFKRLCMLAVLFILIIIIVKILLIAQLLEPLT